MEKNGVFHKITTAYRLEFWKTRSGDFRAAPPATFLKDTLKKKDFGKGFQISQKKKKKPV